MCVPPARVRANFTRAGVPTPRSPCPVALFTKGLLSPEPVARLLAGRFSLPALASAIVDQIGRQTDGATVATIKENSEAVDFIKRGL